MRIKLTYVGYLRFEGVKSGDAIELPDGSTVADVLTRYRMPAAQQRFLTTFVNQEECNLKRELADGDELTVIIQIGGGKDDRPSCRKS